MALKANRAAGCLQQNLSPELIEYRQTCAFLFLMKNIFLQYLNFGKLTASICKHVMDITNR